MAVYLLHSTVPLVRESGREVRHYLGWTCEGNMPKRLEAHYENRKSARIVQAFLAGGAELWLGNYWPGLDRSDERRMKRAGHLQTKCLQCELLAVEQKCREMATAAGVSLPLGEGRP